MVSASPFGVSNRTPEAATPEQSTARRMAVPRVGSTWPWARFARVSYSMGRRSCTSLTCGGATIGLPTYTREGTISADSIRTKPSKPCFSVALTSPFASGASPFGKSGLVPVQSTSSLSQKSTSASVTASPPLANASLTWMTKVLDGSGGGSTTLPRQPQTGSTPPPPPPPAPSTQTPSTHVAESPNPREAQSAAASHWLSSGESTTVQPEAARTSAHDAEATRLTGIRVAGKGGESKQAAAGRRGRPDAAHGGGDQSPAKICIGRNTRAAHAVSLCWAPASC